MAVKIRLMPVGKKKQKAYRIVVVDKRKKVKGQAVEIVGFYDPKNRLAVKLKRDRINYWLNQGAQLSARVASLL